jgi:hypothetical protein
VNEAVWAVVLSYAAAYGIRDSQVINDVASELCRGTFATPADMRSQVLAAFDSHGLHMV